MLPQLLPLPHVVGLLLINALMDVPLDILMSLELVKLTVMLLLNMELREPVRTVMLPVTDVLPLELMIVLPVQMDILTIQEPVNKIQVIQELTQLFAPLILEHIEMLP